jgi:hypothetical protein
MRVNLNPGVEGDSGYAFDNRGKARHWCACKDL